MRTREVFSLTPVMSDARLSISSSMFNVVLICINMHYMGISCKRYFRANMQMGNVFICQQGEEFISRYELSIQLTMPLVRPHLRASGRGENRRFPMLGNFGPKVSNDWKNRVFRLPTIGNEAERLIRNGDGLRSCPELLFRLYCCVPILFHSRRSETLLNTEY